MPVLRRDRVRNSKCGVRNNAQAEVTVYSRRSATSSLARHSAFPIPHFLQGGILKHEFHQPLLTRHVVGVFQGGDLRGGLLQRFAGLGDDLGCPGFVLA